MIMSLGILMWITNLISAVSTDKNILAQEGNKVFYSCPGREFFLLVVVKITDRDVKFTRQQRNMLQPLLNNIKCYS